MTYTYAILDVSANAYREIREKLAAAGYQHAFADQGDGEVIDMHGIALKADPCCGCCHVPDFGPCQRGKRRVEIGANGRCVYCDHAVDCHPGRSGVHNTPLGVRL